MLFRSRLIGGCVETMANLAGTPYGDVRAFGEEHAEDGLIVYLEVSDDAAPAICRNLHGLRLAGWFDRAAAVLVGSVGAAVGVAAFASLAIQSVPSDARATPQAAPGIARVSLFDRSSACAVPTAVSRRATAPASVRRNLPYPRSACFMINPLKRKISPVARLLLQRCNEIRTAFVKHKCSFEGDVMEALLGMARMHREAERVGLSGHEILVGRAG